MVGIPVYKIIDNHCLSRSQWTWGILQQWDECGMWKWQIQTHSGCTDGTKFECGIVRKHGVQQYACVDDKSNIVQLSMRPPHCSRACHRRQLPSAAATKGVVQQHIQTSPRYTVKLLCAFPLMINMWNSLP